MPEPQLVDGEPLEVLVHLVNLGELLALGTSVSVPIRGFDPIALDAPLTKQDVALVALDWLNRNAPANQALKVFEKFLSLNDLVGVEFKRDLLVVLRESFDFFRVGFEMVGVPVRGHGTYNLYN